MFEIVAFHLSGRLPLLDGLGLPIFLLLSIAFSVVSAEKRGLSHVASMRFRKIGLPWIFWWFVYAAFMSLLAVHRGRPLTGVFTPLMVLYGPSVHLWFCPFIIMAGVGMALLHLWTRKGTGYLQTVLTLILAFACPAAISSEEVIRGHGLRGLRLRTLHPTSRPPHPLHLRCLRHITRDRRAPTLDTA